MISPPPRTVYEQQLQALKLAVEFAASGTTIQQYLARGDRGSLCAYLERIRKDAGFDFLGLTDGAEAWCCGCPARPHGTTHLPSAL